MDSILAFSYSRLPWIFRECNERRVIVEDSGGDIVFQQEADQIPPDIREGEMEKVKSNAAFMIAGSQLYVNNPKVFETV